MSKDYSVLVRDALAPALIALVLVSAGAPRPVDAQSLNCNLLAHVDSLPGAGSSCWGYVNPSNGDEYAILGNQFGTAVFNIVDPTAPYLTGFIVGPNSSWREMKTVGSYCYVGTEGGGGLQIIDLSNPEAPFLATTYTGNGLSSIHTVTADTTVTPPKLYLNGSNPQVSGNAMRILSLANPTGPTELGVYTLAYVHDSYVVRDTCYAACITIGRERILNCANPAAITLIVGITTPGASTHNSWPTADRNYLLITDETSGGQVTSWDINPISTPTQVDAFTADASGDAHNVHIRDNFAYVAHYTSGLQILDIADPTNLTRVGYYDTYAPAGGLFNGNWGLYCWFPSTTIVLSDIEGGMFLVDFIESPGYVSGQVTDTVTLLPIPFARVKIVETGASDSTDGSGNYFLAASAGSYTLETTAYGHVTDSTPLAVTQGDTATVDVGLVPVPSGSISGTFEYSGGPGIANATVKVSGSPLSATTNGSGGYSFPQVPSGPQTVTLDFWTCLPESVQTTVTEGKNFLNSVVDFPFEAVTFAFNMEDTSSSGWVVNADATDNATIGQWVRVNPIGTGAQPEDDHTPDPLALCWVTGQGTAGGSIGQADVDGGRTTLYSPIMDLSTLTDPTIEYYRWYSNDGGSNPGVSVWKVQISSNGGTTWVTTDSTRTDDESWKRVRVRVADYVTPSSTVRVRFIADDSIGSIVEAGIDDFRVWRKSAIVSIEGPSGTGSPTLRFALHPNSPNPFNPKTEIRFDLPVAGPARLAVYSLDGRLVKTLASGRQTAGRHAVTWNGRDDGGHDVASGVYVMRLEAGPSEATRKLTLVK
jgi:choice-of-anchor B domain-containing protein